MIKIPKLTDRELEVMNILWDGSREMTINEISETSQDVRLTVPCVAQVIPRLLEKKMLHIENFISAKTKYARTFIPDISRDDYMISELRQLLGKKREKSSIMGMVNMLVNVDEDEEKSEELLNALESYVAEQKKHIGRKGAE